MTAKGIYFNSWLEEYRTPFGAVKEAQKVTFSVQVNLLNVEYVGLVITKDSEVANPIYQKMRVVENGLYTISYKLNQGAGLYFYHFKIIQKEGEQGGIFLYGSNEGGFGGEGKVYLDGEKLHNYQLTCYRKTDTAPNWYQKAVFYHIFVDRFYNGNSNNEILNPKKNTFIYGTKEDTPYYIKDNVGEVVRWDFFGGNLVGIIEKLVYLKELGVTALYLSPIFESRSNHKYDTGNYKKIDSMFGDNDIFKQLIQAAHEVEMHVILDGVFNHVGADSLYFNRLGTYSEIGAFQSMASPYANWFTFDAFPTNYEAWWGIKDLPTANKMNKKYQEFIYAGEESVIKWWGRYGIDGWRIDVADELPDFFLAGIRQTMENENPEAILIGEVWEDASNKIAYNKRHHYLEGGILHGVMNYPFKELILSLIQGKITSQEVALRSLSLKENYPPAAFKNNFNNIGTHDTKRVLTEFNENNKKLRLAASLLFTLPGIPCIYYGDEVGLTGGIDPDNRKFFPWSKMNQEIYSYYHDLIKLRKGTATLQQGEYFPFYNESVFGFLRWISNNNFSIILINSTEQSQWIRYSDFTYLTRVAMVKELLQQHLGEFELDAEDYYIATFIMQKRKI